MKKLHYIVIAVFVFYLLGGTGVGFAQTNKIDSLLTLIKTDKEDTTKITHLNDLAWDVKNNNPDTSIIISNEALILAKKIGWQPGIAISYHQIGVFHYFKGDFANAIKYYAKALEIWEALDKNGDQQYKLRIIYRKSKTICNLGLAYGKKGDYPKALEYDLQALKIDETLQNKPGVARNLGNIGLIYVNQNDNHKALEYFLRALKINEEIGSKEGMAICLSNIGLIYNKQGNYAKALEYYLKALKIIKELGNKNGVATILSNIGSVYTAQGEQTTNSAQVNELNNKALEYYLTALELDKELSNKNGLAIRLANIGSLYAKQKKYKTAEEYLIHALKITEEIGILDIKREVEKTLSELYFSNGEYKNAYEHYKQYSIAKDSLFSEEKNKELTRKEMNYEFDKKEAVSKAEQDKKDAVAAAESKRQRLFLLLIAAVAVAVAVIAIVIFRSLRVTRKQKQIIEIKNRETEEQKRTIEEAHESLSEKNKDILDSIYYARRIQRSLLTSEKYINKTLKRLMKI